MKKLTIFASLIAFVSLQPPVLAQSAEPAEAALPVVPEYSVLVGSPVINAAVIEPYHAIWNTAHGFIEERLTAADETRWQHVQRTFAPLSRETMDEFAMTDEYLAAEETRLIMRDTLASNYLLRNLLRESRDPSASRTMEIVADAEGFAGIATRIDGEKLSWQLRTGRESFDGWIAGLAIAALPLAPGYSATIPTVTHLFRGSHSLTLTVIGQVPVTVGTGDTVDCWEVEASWVELATGDVYEPGREGSGGSYYIALHPGDGVPYVVEYASSGSSIIWDGVRREP